MRDLLALKESFTEQGILISFNGAFTHSIIEEMGNAIKRYLEGENLGRGAIMDVFAVYIEQTQNVRNYLNRLSFDQPQRNTAIVVIGNVDGAYVVSSGNTIARADVQDLTRRLTEINALDKDGLKKLYKETLRKPRESDAKGAGIGLIDIARRARLPLAWSFREIDQDFSFFSLMVTVMGEDK
ncbi:MAG TPA: hypothetical protein DIC34_02110 [Treponema sp.]|nr:MAG: hypothetical protein A2Y36_05375 [Treponema sp. GWA1_62_8]OHE69365.1 MAG: hypothetical protein A2001_03215 [Treponema sp. GWC1_61_84]OHE75529.1 MAG: hypothetical protein A2413_18290 [Treponema sp. RIFOXYC1_FULL_61_9]HCM25337.1 hypothetical protein [Treponema sp.]